TRGTPLAVKSPETWYIHLSSKDHVMELKDAPEELLSLHALSKDMFKPKYTMNGLEVEDKMKANGSLHTRVLRVVLRSHLLELCSPLSRILHEVFDSEFSRTKKTGEEWVKLPIFPTAKTVITAANALTFFGTELAYNLAFLEAAAAYPEDLLFTAETLRLLPSILHPFLAPILMRNYRASKTMVKFLTPLIEERLRRSKDGNWGFGEKPADCIQFFVDANIRGKDTWTARKVVQVLLGTWFAAVHQTALTAVYALEDLCRHMEYIDPLRQEIFSLLSQEETHTTSERALGVKSASVAAALENAPILDAFLKESSRLHPSDSISVRRKVLEPFTFQDGTHILPGDVVCVPMQAMMLDEEVYPDSAAFDPLRFVTPVDDHDNYEISAENMPSTVRNTSRFTDSDFAYPLWGLGKHSCPGRYYASMILKIFVAHIITHYEIKLPEQHASRTFHFRSAIIPKASSSLLFRRRID
ncbi:putative cytochrome P450, partial [Thozetella sp. PMI_491]